MGKMIYIIIQLVIILLFVCQFFVSIQASKIKNCPRSVRYFYWYPIVGIVVGFFLMLDYLFHAITSELRSNILILSLLFHFNFLSTILYKETGSKPFLKYLFILLTIILVKLVISNFTIKGANSYAFANAVLFIFSAFYFYQLFNNSNIVNLSKDPLFILCAGIFLGTGITIPFTYIQDYLILIKIQENLLFLFGALSSLGYLIMNLFFLKSMICITQRS